MPLTHHPYGISSFGVPVLPQSFTPAVFGGVATTYFVDPTGGDSANSGLGPTEAFISMTNAFDVMSKWDMTLCAPGNHTGNHTTPLNATAPFCSLIGLNAINLGTGPWAGATVATSPILSVRARGWNIEGWEFDCPTGAAGVKLTTSGTSNSNYARIAQCLFTGGAGTGKYGIDWSGAPTYTQVFNNRFDGFGASGATAFVCTDSGTDVPRMCRIHGNEFQENTSHIAMNPRGFKMSIIDYNFFHLDGHTRDATVLLDVRGGGGNTIAFNFFDCTVTQYKDDSSSAFIRTNATDCGIGNWCYDGIPDGDISD